MQLYLSIVQIVLSVALTAIILLQVRSSSSTSSVFGGMDSPVYRTRRGIEKTIFNVTIGLSIVFFAITLVNVIVLGS
jgi:preprotein translocase subunit SecG